MISCSAPYARTSDRGLTHVRLTGELDLASVPALTEALERPADGHSLLVVLDMRTVTFLDVCTAGVLLGVHAAVREDGGRMVLVRGAVAFDRWLDLLDLDDGLEVVGLERLDQGA